MVIFRSPKARFAVMTVEVRSQSRLMRWKRSFQVAAPQPKGDPLNIVIELTGHGAPADCFGPYLLHGYPWKSGKPVVNPEVLGSRCPLY